MYSGKKHSDGIKANMFINRKGAIQFRIIVHETDQEAGYSHLLKNNQLDPRNRSFEVIAVSIHHKLASFQVHRIHRPMVQGKKACNNLILSTTHLKTHSVIFCSMFPKLGPE